MPKIYGSTTLVFCASPYELYGFPLPRKSCPTPSSIFVPEKYCTDSLGMRANISRNPCCCSPRFLCTINVVRPLKSVLYGLIFNVVCCLVIRACCFPWDACLSYKCCLSSQSSTSLLSFFLSQQKCMNNPKMGAPSNPNRPHEVGEEFSNPMAEIRLDEWLRFYVSSFTLTKVIKSPFNLHLTN
jgi:hypothetical protein